MATTRQRPVSGVVEKRWRPFLEQVDKSRLRRSRALVKAGAVRDLECVGGEVRAIIRQAGFGGMQVRFPTSGCWQEYEQDIARWFAMRPDWLATFLAGGWDEEYLAFLDAHKIYLFPDKDAVGEWTAAVRCDCGESAPCTHVLAAVLRMVEEVEQNPLQLLYYAGIGFESMMRHVRRQSASVWADTHQERRRTEGQRTEGQRTEGQRGSSAELLAVWPEEEALAPASATAVTPTTTESIRHVIAPIWRYP